MNIKINHATQKTQRQTHGPTGLCELFLLTVPIEEVAQARFVGEFDVDAGSGEGVGAVGGGKYS